MTHIRHATPSDIPLTLDDWRRMRVTGEALASLAALANAEVSA